MGRRTTGIFAESVSGKTESEIKRMYVRRYP